MDENKTILQQILVAEVLQLAKQIDAERQSKGVTSTSDYIPDAVKLIKKETPRILELLHRL